MRERVGTLPGRAGGTYSFLVKSGVDTAFSPGFPWLGPPCHTLAAPVRRKGPAQWAGPLLEKSVCRLFECLQGTLGADIVAARDGQ